MRAAALEILPRRKPTWDNEVEDDDPAGGGGSESGDTGRRAFMHWRENMPEEVMDRLMDAVRTEWTAVGAWWSMLSRGVRLSDARVEALAGALASSCVREVPMVLETFAWIRPKEITVPMVQYVLSGLEKHASLACALFCSWWPKSYIALRSVEARLDCKVMCKHLASAKDLRSAIRYVCAIAQMAEVAGEKVLYPELLDCLKLFSTHVFLEFGHDVPARFAVGLECALRTLAKCTGDLGLIRLLKNFIGWNEDLCVDLLVTQVAPQRSTAAAFDDSAEQVLVSRLRLTKAQAVQERILQAMAKRPAPYASAGGLSIVLSMMRRTGGIKCSRALACEAAARMAPFNAHTERAPEAERVVPLCAEQPRLIRVLYDGRGTVSQIDELFRLLRLSSKDFSSSNFEMTVVLIWRALAPKDGGAATAKFQAGIVDYADRLAGHLGGNCAYLRKTIRKHCDFSQRGPLMEVSYEPEIHMWKAISYKRSLLETTKATPQDLRRGSRIFGFFETEKDAYHAYTLACNGKRPLPPAPAQEDEELVRVRGAVCSRVQVILGLLSELHALSKVELEADHAKQLVEFDAEVVEHIKERAAAQELFEESLELEDIPASRVRFQALEKLQAKADRERRRSLVRSHRHQRCQVYGVLRNPDFIADLFYIGFSSAFHAQAKARAVDLLSYVLFDDPEKAAQEDEDEFDDEDEDEELQEDPEPELELDEETDEDSGSDDGDEGSRGPGVLGLGPKVNGPSIRKIWNQKMDELLFGKPRMFFEVRFTAVLCTLLRTSAASDMRQIALEHLVRIASQPSTKQTIAKMDGIPILMTCLREATPTEAHQQNVTLAALTLRQLAVDPLNAQLMSMDGGFDALLSLGSHELAGKLIKDIVRVISQHPYNATNVYAHELPRYTRRKSFAPVVMGVDVTKAGAMRVHLDPLIFTRSAGSTNTASAEPETTSDSRAVPLCENEAKIEDHDCDAEERQLAQTNANAAPVQMNEVNSLDDQSRSLQVNKSSIVKGKGKSFVFEKNARARVLDPMERANARLWMFPQTNGVLQELPVYQGPDGVRFHLFVDAEPQVEHYIPSARRPDPSDAIDTLDLEDDRPSTSPGFDLEALGERLDARFVPSLRICPNPPDRTPEARICHSMLDPLTGQVLHDEVHICAQGEVKHAAHVVFSGDRAGDAFRLEHHKIISSLAANVQQPDEAWLDLLGIPGGKLGHEPTSAQEWVVALAVSSTRLPVPRALLTPEDSYLDLLQIAQDVDWSVEGIQESENVATKVEDLTRLLDEAAKKEQRKKAEAARAKTKRTVRKSKRTRKLMGILEQIDPSDLMPSAPEDARAVIHAYQASRVLLQAPSYNLPDSKLIEIHQHIPPRVLQRMRVRIQSEIEAMDPKFKRK
ncbi:Hypothetical Protein FCC1311_093912 [Hondaea fermentalgiana]|uniref:Uncharacterized protein n=1 Tax=Hondaea fermentalgiana TaxID=2315210 RepID=A0A2R5GQL6_9STRA|nr:Hypothetical Protein FCC1311_093912 [Hondaea fermentalgiana]|eukprot:GBG33167.1 Hypothetical Protein FCC1311_093912 [Hondaea fermentalgiana]